MKFPTPKSKLNLQIYEEACEWVVHFRVGDADHDATAARQLDDWLRRSPEHVRAYLEASALWEDAASHDPGRSVDADAHIARALSEVNVVPLGPETDTASATTERRRFSARLVAVAASIAVLAVAGLITWVQLRSITYTTAIGEQRSIILDDGSTIELNARSRVRVHFTQQQRSIDLLEGQALFRVAKDHARPFVVSSDRTRVRAVGTQFDVHRKKSGTTVTVIEGQVAVRNTPIRLKQRVAVPRKRPGDDAVVPAIPAVSEEVLLAAGQQLTVTPVAVARPTSANVAAATAWTRHELLFDAAPLAEVADEFNRYNKRPIIIQDEALEQFGVIGVFSSTDPDSLLRFLRSQPEIQVIETDVEILITRK